jgi:ABC-type branched-subunit amino acid transport system substrate-binding protein
MFYLQTMRKIYLIFSLFLLYFQSIAQNKSLIKIALLMPFCAEEINQNSNHKNADLGNACREYYQGLLIAADSLKSAGYNIEITIFDTDRDTVKFKKILMSEAVQYADFIIGPVIKEGQLMMQNFKNKKNAFHLSPLFTFTKTKINDERVISAYPDLTFYADYFVNYLNKNSSVGNIIVLVGKDVSDKSLANYLKQIVKPELPLKVKQIDLSKVTDIYKNLSKESDNYIFIASDDENQINAALKIIADTSNTYKMNTFSLRKILDFNIINTEYWLKSNLHIISPFYVDYKDLLTKKFIETYRIYYETEPNEFAFVGYDQLITTVSTFALTNGSFKDLNKMAPHSLLANRYLLKEKNNSSGLQNSYLHILKYTDEGLVEVGW